MKKLLLGVVVVFSGAGAMLAVGAHAAPASAKSPYCNMAAAGNNGYAARESWADYYHRWGGAAGPEPVVHHAAPAPAKNANPYCNMAAAGNNGYAARESWADYYHCWG